MTLTKDDCSVQVLVTLFAKEPPCRLKALAEEGLYVSALDHVQHALVVASASQPAALVSHGSLSVVGTPVTVEQLAPCILLSGADGRTACGLATPPPQINIET